MTHASLLYKTYVQAMRFRADIVKKAKKCDLAQS